jgi:hypothetical protein
MQIIFLLLLVIPLSSISQNHRSAKELAQETIHEYLATKLSIPSPYHAEVCGDLRSQIPEKNRVAWVMDYRFELKRPNQDRDGEEAKPHLFRIFFSFDRKMKIIQAECYESR